MDLHERIAELESKLESSVAHNLALRKFITDSCYVFEGEQSDYSDAYVTADEYMPLNPAGGAEIINALRAEGEKQQLTTIDNELGKLAGAMLNRTLDTSSKQAVGYAECAAMVAKFAAQLRNGEHVREEGV